MAKKKVVRKSSKKKVTAKQAGAAGGSTTGKAAKASAAKSADAGTSRATAGGKKRSTKKTATTPATQTAAPAAPPRRTTARVVRPAPPQAEAQEHIHQHLSESKLKRCKSGLTRKEVNELRKNLLEKRAEIVGDVLSMEEDARSNGTSGNLSHMPVHMADVGSDYYQQEFTLSLVESERKLLREIDGALDRIEKGYYGVCMETGKPIGKPRLEIKPWAKYSIEVVREREKRGLM